MKTLYLHIGLHKTATKTIQLGLANRKKNLLDRNYYIPISGNLLPNMAEHNRLTNALRYNKDQIYIFDELLDEIKQRQEENIIISAEGFSELDEESIWVVKNYFKEFNVKIVIYLRRQDAWLQSLWIQDAKLGVTLKPFIEWTMDPNQKHHTFENYAGSLKLWSGLFGKENIIVRVFEKAQLKQGIFPDFLQSCRVPRHSGIKFESVVHSSPGVKVLSISQFVFSKIKPHIKHAVYHRACKEIFRSIAQFADIHNWQDKKYNAITPELYKLIMNRYDEQNVWIAREFFGRENLFIEPFKEKPIDTSYDFNKLTGTEIIELMAFVISDLLRFQLEK